MGRDLIDQLESQLVEATRHGEAPRVKRARMRVARWVSTPAAGAAIAVAASATAIAAGLTGPLASHAHHQAPVAKAAKTPSQPATIGPKSSSSSSPSVAVTPTAIPAGGPVPTGFQPKSFTAISEYTWWLMGSAPCPHKPCTSIVRTVNGGVSFVGLHAPRTVHVSQLRFANEDDGFAFGPKLWVTHDGGQHWSHLRKNGPVWELAAAGKYVYAIMWHKGSARLLRSPVHVNRWRRIGPRRIQVSSGLWVQGHTVIVESQSSTAARQHVYISRNSGHSFRKVGKAPISLACSFDATATAHVIWAPCATGTMSSVWRSTNGGHSFRIAIHNSGSGPGLELPNSAAFGAASGRTAVVGYRRLYRTTDAGRHWRKVTSLPLARQVTYIGFSDSTHGVAVGQWGSSGRRGWRLYYTTNSGASYHFVPITP